MSEFKYQYTFYVYPREVDFTKRMTLTALGSCILDAAGLAAVDGGFSMDQMHSEGLAWVVSRLAIEMDEFPQEYCEFHIETWIESVSALVSTRHFIIRNHLGNTIGRATSLWSLISKERRRPVNLMDQERLIAFVNGSKLELEAPKRIGTISESSTTLHQVVYSDIDINGHVNSFKYVQWVMDTYPLEQFQDKKVKRFDVNYSHEALYGAQVYAASKQEGNEHAFELSNGDNQCYLVLTST